MHRGSEAVQLSAPHAGMGGKGVRHSQQGHLGAHTQVQEHLLRQHSL